MGNYHESNNEEETIEQAPSAKHQTDVVLPYLELDCQHIPDSVDKFIAALRAFVNDPSDVTGLKVDNLREMAKRLRMTFERVDGQLAIIEQRAEKHSDG